MTNQFDAVIAAFENGDPIALAGGCFGFLSIAIVMVSKIFFRDKHLGRYAMSSLTLSFLAIAWIAFTYEPPGESPFTCKGCSVMINQYESYRNPLVRKWIKKLGADHDAVLELRVAKTGKELRQLRTEEQVQSEIEASTSFLRQTLQDYGLE